MGRATLAAPFGNRHGKQQVYVRRRGVLASRLLTPQGVRVTDAFRNRSNSVVEDLDLLSELRRSETVQSMQMPRVGAGGAYSVEPHALAALAEGYGNEGSSCSDDSAGAASDEDEEPHLAHNYFGKEAVSRLHAAYGSLRGRSNTVPKRSPIIDRQLVLLRTPPPPRGYSQVTPGVLQCGPGRAT